MYEIIVCIILNFMEVAMNKKLSLEMKNISKKFGDFVANDNVNLSIYGGEIHALLGENGAGKSTLMNILTGIYKPNSGSIFLNDKKVEILSPKTAVSLGIGMVHQHFQLVSTLSVSENIYLNIPECKRILNYGEMEKNIKEYSEKFNLQVDPKAKIWQLSVGEQQRVEILKLLCRNTEILILDEPSAVLTPQEAREMFKTLRSMANEGKAIIFISHKLNEVMENADRITVLKNGKLETSMQTSEATIDKLTKAVIGNRTPKVIEKASVLENAKTIIKINEISTLNDKGIEALKQVSFNIREGEIFGIAGVAGNGQKELSEAVAGIRRLQNGTVQVDDKDIGNLSRREHIKSGIAFIPEDRLEMGLVPEMNMMENSILKDFKEKPYSKYGILKGQKITELTKKFIAKFSIRHGGEELPVSMMSGGNQQKLLIAREIEGKPKVIIAAYPIRGLDIGAAEVINEILFKEKERGAAILLISEELDEIFGTCDRVGVLCDGKLMGIKNVKDTNYEEIGRMMSGEYA